MCDSDIDASRAQCRYKVLLDRVPSTDLMTTVFKEFKWTAEDQNTVSTYISQDGMDPDAAAAKWIADNSDMVNSWLGS